MRKYLFFIPATGISLFPHWQILRQMFADPSIMGSTTSMVRYIPYEVTYMFTSMPQPGIRIQDLNVSEGSATEHAAEGSIQK